jgi:hypothetical protein
MIPGLHPEGAHPVLRPWQTHQHVHPWQHFFQTPMVLQTIYHLQGKVVCETPPLDSLTTKVQIRPMQGLIALQEPPMDTHKVRMLSTRTAREPRMPSAHPRFARRARIYRRHRTIAVVLG